MKTQYRHMWIFVSIAIPVLLLVFTFPAMAQIGDCSPGTDDLGYLPGAQPYAGRVCRNAADPIVSIQPDAFAPCGARIQITDTADIWYFAPPVGWISPTSQFNFAFLLRSQPVTSTFTVESLTWPEYVTWTTAATGGYSVLAADDWTPVLITATGSMTDQLDTVYRISNAGTFSYDVASIRVWDSSDTPDPYCKAHKVLFPDATPGWPAFPSIGFPTPFPTPAPVVTNTITGTLQTDVFWDITNYTSIISGLQTMFLLEGMQRLVEILLFLGAIFMSLAMIKWLARGLPGVVPGGDSEE